jgi:DNA polymerase elongation subunit (family B)
LESIKEQNNTILENIKELVDSSTKDGSSNLISSNYLDSLQQFFEGKLLNKESIIKCKFIKSEKRELVMDIKILAFDIECYLNNNNNFIPYACGFSNGINTNLYYLIDYKDSNDMLESCLMNMLFNYNKYIVYVHNFSNFDYYFIINFLKNKLIIKSDSFYKDNKLYSLKLSTMINNKIHFIIIKDSYLLLKDNLRKLGKDYNVNILKGYFPYTFVN